MADAKRLIRLGIAVPLAKEIARQITAGSGSVSRLLSLGLPALAAKELVRQFSDGGDAPRLTSVGIVPVVAREISAQIAGGVLPPVVDHSLAAGRLGDTFAGTASAVTSITNEGNGGWNLPVTGTAPEVQHSERGFEFADGKYATVASLPAPSLGGIFMVVRATLDSYGSGVQALLEANATGATLVLRNNGGTMQAVYNDGSARTITLGPATYGQQFVIGIEVDNDANRVRVFKLDGTVEQSTPAATPLINYVTVRTGQRVIGAIAEWDIFTKPVGGAFAYTFEDVIADFQGA